MDELRLDLEFYNDLRDFLYRHFPEENYLIRSNLSKIILNYLASHGLVDDIR